MQPIVTQFAASRFQQQQRIGIDGNSLSDGAHLERDIDAQNLRDNDRNTSLQIVPKNLILKRY